MSVADALRAMKVAEVGVLVLDAQELYIHRQELAICNAIINEGRALVIAANKMDLLEMSSEFKAKDFADGVRAQLEDRIPILRNTPIIPMSCRTGEGVSDLLPAVMDAKNRWARTISTGLLNRWLKEVVAGTAPPVVSGIRAKLKYIIQTKGRPPSFMLFCNVGQLPGKNICVVCCSFLFDSNELFSIVNPDSYLRYLTKHFQESFDLYGMPIRIIVKKSAKSNPYSKEKKQRGGFGLGGKESRHRRRIKKFMTKKARSV
jgi:GTP-binding protein